MRHILGESSDIQEGKAKAYTLAIDDTLKLSLFVVRHDGEFYAYKNHCPHTGINLEWQADQFLDISAQRIQCSTHGALFRIDNGLCEWGPCLGKYLEPLNIEHKKGKLILTPILAHDTRANSGEENKR